MTAPVGSPLPPGWAWSTIGGVTESRIPQQGPKEADPFTYVDISSVDNSKKLISGPKSLRLSEAPTRARQNLRAGDVLVSMTRPNLNAVAFVPKALDGAIGSTGFDVLRTRAVDSRWLYYFVQTPEFVRAMSSKVLGVLYPAVRPREIREYSLPIAPLPEQRRIVEAIETRFARLDAAVKALERARVNLRRYRASVLVMASEGRLFSEAPESLFNPNHNGGGRRGGDLRVLPPTWAWTKIGAVGDVQLGRQRAPEHHHGSHMHRYLRVANVFEDRIDLSDVKEMNFSPREFEKYSLRVGDILLNEGQTPELVGRPAMVRAELPGYCFQNTLVRFRANDLVVPAFALVVFRAYLHKLRFQRIAQITTNIAHLGVQRFSEVEFPLPPLSEQRSVALEVERRLSIADESSGEVEHTLARCVRVRASILRSAFEGRLVPQDPDDEHASALLERIRTANQVTSKHVRRAQRLLPAG